MSYPGYPPYHQPNNSYPPSQQPYPEERRDANSSPFVYPTPPPYPVQQPLGFSGNVAPAYPNTLYHSESNIPTVPPYPSSTNNPYPNYQPPYPQENIPQNAPYYQAQYQQNSPGNDFNNPNTGGTKDLGLPSIFKKLEKYLAPTPTSPSVGQMPQHQQTAYVQENVPMSAYPAAAYQGFHPSMYQMPNTAAPPAPFPHQSLPEPQQRTYAQTESFSQLTSNVSVDDLSSQVSKVQLTSETDEQQTPVTPVETSTPSLTPASPFEPRRDAEALRKAMKGLGCDETAVVNILAHRSSLQRQEIARQYKTLYGKDLVAGLRSELGGKLEQLVLASMTPLPEFYCSELRRAVSGLGTDEDAIIEILCTLDNQTISAVNAEYTKMFKTSLEKDVQGDTSGLLRRLLVALCQGARDEGGHVDAEAARADAQELYSAGEGKLGTDESTFMAVLASRSFAQLRQVFAEYEKISHHPFEHAIKSEFSGNLEKALLAVVKCVRSRAEYLAELVHASVAGLGTKDRALIRLVVTRAELDLGDVKTAFQLKYGKSMAACVAGDTSGNYKKMLLAMIG